MLKAVGNPEKNQNELEILTPDYTQKASLEA